MANPRAVPTKLNADRRLTGQPSAKVLLGQTTTAGVRPNGTRHLLEKRNIPYV